MESSTKCVVSYRKSASMFTRIHHSHWILLPRLGHKLQGAPRGSLHYAAIPVSCVKQSVEWILDPHLTHLAPSLMKCVTIAIDHGQECQEPSAPVSTTLSTPSRIFLDSRYSWTSEIKLRSKLNAPTNVNTATNVDLRSECFRSQF